jgi:hypothetical protein
VLAGRQALRTRNPGYRPVGHKLARLKILNISIVDVRNLATRFASFAADVLGTCPLARLARVATSESGL